MTWARLLQNIGTSCLFDIVTFGSAPAAVVRNSPRLDHDVRQIAIIPCRVSMLKHHRLRQDRENCCKNCDAMGGGDPSPIMWVCGSSCSTLQRMKEMVCVGEILAFAFSRLKGDHVRTVSLAADRAV